LYCKEDHDHMEKTSAPTTPHLPSAESNNNTSLSNNNHSSNSTELGCMSEKPRRLSYCVGCGGQIHDQYILRVAPDLEWHAACLKCQECRQFLDESCTCFVRDGKTYCKRDYVRSVAGNAAKSPHHRATNCTPVRRFRG
jgi:hypothetical protein